MSRRGETEIGMVWKLFDETGRRVEGPYDFNLTVMRTGMTGKDMNHQSGREQEFDHPTARLGMPDDIEQFRIQCRKSYDW